MVQPPPLTVQHKNNDGSYNYEFDDADDIVIDCSIDAGCTSIIHMGEETNQGWLEAGTTRIGNDLVVTCSFNTSKIILSGYYKKSSFKAVEFILSDGTILDTKKIESMITFRGTDDNDVISGFETDDIIIGGNGNDILYGGGGNDTIYAGNTYGYDTFAHDTLIGGAGNDTLRGTTQGSTYVYTYGDGFDTIMDAGSSVGDSDTFELHDIDLSQIKVIQNWNDMLVSIIDNNNPNVINGSINIQNGFGSGKIENFILDGKSLTFEEVKTLLLTSISGNTIENDSLKFRDGITPNDVIIQATADGTDLIIAIKDNDKALEYLSEKTTISNFFVNNTIEKFIFSNGIILSPIMLLNLQVASEEKNILRYIFGNITIDALGGDDIIITAMGDDTINGGNGDDTIKASSGNDTLIGELGNDVLEGGFGSDVYIFSDGEGRDKIYETSSNLEDVDTIEFTNGLIASDVQIWRDSLNLYFNVKGNEKKITVDNYFNNQESKIEQVKFADGILWNSETINSAKFMGTNGADNFTGTVGNDIFEMAKGNDLVDGGDGNDTYIFNLGDGQDTIGDYSTNSGNTDVISFGDGINSENLKLQYIGDHLVVSIIGTDDKITIKNFNSTNNYEIERLVFKDGTTLNSQQIEKMAVIQGTSGNDTIVGFTKDDTIIAGKGNDTINDQNGNDTYIFNLGDGQDTIYDYSSNTGNKDTIKFGEGITADNLDVTRISDDLIIMVKGTSDKIIIGSYFSDLTYKIEEFSFADNTVLTSAQMESKVILYGTDGADSISAFTTNDTIIAGKGNDTIDDQNGSDTYIFNLGDGADTIYDYSTNAGNKDIIQFGAGITTDNLDVTRIYDDLIIRIKGTTDKITISSYFSDLTYKIEEFSFADGALLNNQQIEEMIVLRGTDGNDTISGYMTNDTIYGGKGDDQLYGDDGSDTYIFNLGDGQDTISDTSYNVDNSDTLQFGANITASMVTMNRDQSNLYFSINGSTDKITVTSHFDMAEYQIEQVTFADGTIWNSTVLNSAKFVGTDGADYISGTSSNNIFEGKKGDDYIDDQNGSDTYIFNLGDGADTIYDYSTNAGNKDIIRFGAGIKSSDLEIVRVDDDLTFSVIGTTDKITVTGWYAATQNKIEQFSFTDGSSLTAVQVQTMLTFLGTTGDDALVGTTNIDILKGFAGNDTLNGGAGADTMLGGTGNDTYTVDNVADVVIELLNEGIDTVKSSKTYTLSANVENLTLTGTTAINAIGNELNNILIGNSGVNALNGEAGNDTLNGGAGADTMLGGTGNDTYTVDNLEDIVTENLNEGTDSINSSVTYALSGNVENLILAGTTAINGTGNTLDNILTGNSGANILNAGKGKDTLNGAAGNDTYLFNLGDGIDSISDSAGNDTVTFGTGIAKSSIAVFKNGSNFMLSYGINDVITIANQSVANNAIEKFTLADGNFLTSNDLNVIIQSMNSYATDHGMSITSLDTVKANQDLMNIVAGAWHK